MKPLRIDAHQHFWRYRADDYPWIGKGMELLAGQGGVTPGGVLPGPLPADLNVVKFLVPGPDRRSLYVGSENSVLKLVLAD